LIIISDLNFQQKR